VQPDCSVPSFKKLCVGVSCLQPSVFIAGQRGENPQ